MPPRYRRGLAVVGAVVLVVHLVRWLPAHVARTDTETLDFPVYQRAAQRLANHEPVYAAAARDLRRPPTAFLYPPPLLAAARPLAFVDPRVFQALAYVGALLAFWIAAAGLARLAGEPRVTGTLAFGALLAPLSIWPMSFGNVEPVVWALLIWGFALGSASGVLLTLAAAIKLYPAIPLAVLLVRRPQYRVQALVTAGAVAGVTTLVTGASVLADWWRIGLPSLSAGIFAPGNISLTTAVLRPFRFEALPPWAAWFLRGAPLPLTVAAAFALRRFEPRMHAALTMVAGLLLSPLCWVHQLALVLVPAAIGLGAQRAHPPSATAQRAG